MLGDGLKHSWLGGRFSARAAHMAWAVSNVVM